MIALVAYIPGALGTFIDALSDSLPGGRRVRSHLTLLPPRPLRVPPHQASKLISCALADMPAFEVELTNVVRFPLTGVLYIALGTGFHEASGAHKVLNQGAFYYPERFEYHPHITLAVPQDGVDVDSLEHSAAETWARFDGSRSFSVNVLDLLQQSTSDEWEKLSQIGLPSGASTHSNISS